MTLLPAETKKRLESKLVRLNKLRPLPKSAVEKLRDKFQVEMTYNSNAIEGNSLTLKETFLVINEGLTVKGKPLKDHLEAKDHQAALEYLYDLVGQRTELQITQNLIKNLHQIIMQKTDKEWAGKYRNSKVVIGGSQHKPVDALQVLKKMEELIAWFNKEIKKKDIVELAAIFHHKLVYIHPFFDGNGRTARLAMNLILMQAGYPLVVILKNDRKKYYRVLSQADNGEYEPLVKFISQAVERSLDIYLKTLTPSSKDQEKFVPLSELAEKTRFSAKYLNLLARKGRLEAHKEGRIWLSSEQAVDRYLKNRERQVKP